MAFGVQPVALSVTVQECDASKAKFIGCARFIKCIEMLLALNFYRYKLYKTGYGKYFKKIVCRLIFVTSFVYSLVKPNNCIRHQQ